MNFGCSLKDNNNQQTQDHDSGGGALAETQIGAMDVPQMLSLLLSSGLRETASTLQRELAGVSNAAAPLVSYREEKNEHTHP
jgi:hypothetical protein